MAGLGLLFIAIIWNIYKGFNYIVLGLYIFGVFLILRWYLSNKLVRNHKDK